MVTVDSDAAVYFTGYSKTEFTLFICHTNFTKVWKMKIFIHKSIRRNIYAFRKLFLARIQTLFLHVEISFDA